jgi:hypothetical protein
VGKSCNVDKATKKLDSNTAPADTTSTFGSHNKENSFIRNFILLGRRNRDGGWIDATTCFIGDDTASIAVIIDVGGKVPSPKIELFDNGDGDVLFPGTVVGFVVGGCDSV